MYTSVWNIALCNYRARFSSHLLLVCTLVQLVGNCAFLCWESCWKEWLQAGRIWRGGGGDNSTISLWIKLLSCGVLKSSYSLDLLMSIPTGKGKAALGLGYTKRSFYWTLWYKRQFYPVINWITDLLSPRLGCGLQAKQFRVSEPLQWRIDWKNVLPSAYVLLARVLREDLGLNEDQ